MKEIQNAKIVEELKKNLIPNEKTQQDKTYTYSEYVIDGHKYSSISDIPHRKQAEFSAEAGIINDFIRMVSSSSESTTKQYVNTLKNIYTKHLDNDDDLSQTFLYLIAKKCISKSYRTVAGSTEREFLLIGALSEIKKKYE